MLRIPGSLYVHPREAECVEESTSSWSTDLLESHEGTATQGPVTANPGKGILYA